MRNEKHNASTQSTALAHAFRDSKVLNADPQKSKLNFFNGNAKTALAEQKILLAEVEKKSGKAIRKDAVTCIEVLVTASPEAFRPGGELYNRKKQDAYFKRALDWIKKTYGPIIGYAIHRDETSPHLSCFTTPVTEDGRLSAKDMIGGRDDMSKAQTSFVEECGKPFQLKRGLKGSPADHETVRTYYKNANQAKASERKQQPDRLGRIMTAIAGNDLSEKQRAAQIIATSDERRKLAKMQKRMTAQQIALDRRESKIDAQQDKLGNVLALEKKFADMQLQYVRAQAQLQKIAPNSFEIDSTYAETRALRQGEVLKDDSETAALKM
jgi:hypothetical protein